MLSTTLSDLDTRFDKLKEIDPYFSASKFRWLLKNTPGIGKLHRAGHVAAGTIDSYLIWQLTAGESRK